MHPEVEKYLKLIDFLAELLGENVEIALHDFSQLENSITAIKNSHVSGRAVGAPATDFVLNILKNEKSDTTDYITNYKSTSSLGTDLKSGSYFIRDKNNEIVGMLCINIDLTRFTQVRDILDAFISLRASSPKEEAISETLSPSTTELKKTTIKKVIDSYGIPPERMDQSEKLQVVEQLNSMGVFLIKGSVSETAAYLGVSNATMYRYLSTIKNN